MPSIVVVHSIAPGKSELYEEFLVKRKVAFIQSLPGVQRYEVLRRDRRIEPESPEIEIPYDIVAVLDVEDLDTFQAARATPEYDAFRNEYVHLLQPRPVVYQARRMQREAALSRDEFWAGRDAS